MHVILILWNGLSDEIGDTKITTKTEYSIFITKSIKEIKGQEIKAYLDNKIKD